NKKDKNGYGLSYLKRIYEKYRLKISVNSDDKVFSVEVPYITLTKNRIYHDQISNC
ncbi:MAG: GHKL domain-containing protein, partial [Muribaculaceae bacterium]|nr:GHKL domain-containing protein [Muribaculaceae bacterium]